MIQANQTTTGLYRYSLSSASYWKCICTGLYTNTWSPQPHLLCNNGVSAPKDQLYLHCLMLLTINWLQSLDKGKEVCAVYFNLRKAFDSVPHRVLLQKLQSSGLNEHISNWLFSYLCGREQYVVLNGKKSCPKPVTSGIPQGSVLGPLLFLAYINDVANEQLSCGSRISLYADDLLLYREISCRNDYLMMQNDINTLSTWVDGNVLTFNASKCKYMIISRLYLVLPFHSTSTLHFVSENPSRICNTGLESVPH